MTIRFLLLCTLLSWLCGNSAVSQEERDSTKTESSTLHFSGYFKNLQNWAFAGEKNSLLTGAFFHNRLIFNWHPSPAWTFDLESRNRLFYGEWVRFQPGFAENLNQDNAWLDLNFVPLKRAALVGSTSIDRLWLQCQKGRWTTRLGRQRINWSMAITWNPNDWFNAYNFLDFDYEERPGADALRLTWQSGDFSTIEAAVSPADSLKNWTGALRFTGNFKRYDWQFLGGVYRNKLAGGFGWAGNLGQAGFKGEVSVFHPLEKGSGNTRVSATAGTDITFGGKWFFNAAALFNSAGRSHAAPLAELNRTNLTPDNLMPGKFSFLTGINHALSPIIQVSFSAVYSPNGQLLILLPATAFSVTENWDIDLTAQLFWMEDNDMWENLLDWIFLRTRWSF